MALMHYPSVRSHLKPYVMVARRRTTINHSALRRLSPATTKYDPRRVKEALSFLAKTQSEAPGAYCGLPLNLGSRLCYRQKLWL